MNAHIHNIAHVIQHMHYHGKHTFEAILGVVGIGSWAATVLGYVQTGLGVAVTIASLVLLVLRIQIARMEKDKMNREKGKDDESA